jgi:ankyrin repeat protein
MGPSEGSGNKSPLVKGIDSKSLLLGLPNELLMKVGSHLESFNDLNSLVRTSSFFHGMFNADLYRRAVAAEAIVLDDIVGWVLSRYRLASLTLMLDHGLPANYTVHFYLTRWKGTMLHFLCALDDQERSVPLAQLLIQRGADTRAKDVGRCVRKTVLAQAIDFGKFEIAALLLAHGVDPNDPDNVFSEGWTPLHCASNVAGDNAEIIHMLIVHGADINARTRRDETPLLVASRFNEHAMSALLDHDADANLQNSQGETPLHQASLWLEWEHHYLAKSLLANGANVNATDQLGRTPLHWVFDERSEEGSRFFLANFLLENGADVNAISNDGLSPLKLALLRKGQAESVELLLHYGADISGMSNEEIRRL